MTALALAALNGKRDVCTFLIECYAWDIHGAYLERGARAPGPPPPGGGI